MDSEPPLPSFSTKKPGKRIKALWLYFVSAFLPFWRLRLSTSRPSWLAMRARNPCFRLPFNVVGVVWFFFIMERIITQVLY